MSESDPELSCVDARAVAANGQPAVEYAAITAERRLQLASRGNAPYVAVAHAHSRTKRTQADPEHVTFEMR